MTSTVMDADANPATINAALKAIGAAMSGMGISTSIADIRTGICVDAVMSVIVSDHASAYINRESTDTRHSSKSAAAGQVIGKP